LRAGATAFSATLTAAAAAMHRTAARAPKDGGAGRPVIEWGHAVAASVARALSEDNGRSRLNFCGRAARCAWTRIDWRPGRAQFRAALDGRTFSLSVKPTADGYLIRHRAAQVRTRVLTPLASDLASRLPERAPPDTSRQVVSPCRAGDLDRSDPGQEVRSGETLAVIEA
jgi:propionyl-CoA carboxylase alpha chain